MAPSATRTRTSTRVTTLPATKASKQDTVTASAAKSTKTTKATPRKAKSATTATTPVKKAPAASGRKRTKQEAQDDEDEEEEEESDESEDSDRYKDDSEQYEDNQDEDADDSDDDDFQSSDDIRTRKSRIAKSKTSAPSSSTKSKKTLSSKSTTKSASTPTAKKQKTSTTTATTASTKKSTKPGTNNPEPSKTFLVSPLKIPRPKGGPFGDAIQPETLEFLRDLKLNNDREYMMLNQARCDEAKADFLDFIRMLKDGLLEADPDVLDVEPKQSMMRIHRDIRFSNDKTPYKDHFSCYFSKGGKKTIAAGYYFGVGSDGSTFAGCGVWDPQGAALNRIRHGIVNHADRFKAILETDAIKEITGGKSGIDALRESKSALKTGPAGFDKNHPMIEFLKRKAFAIGRYFDDEQVVSEGFLEAVLTTFDACVDLVHILNEWIG
ncbi:hypothetical protein BGX33_004983 [Mortierella sp. NVP41]|nr:hypothetical protein BGX33_004983 [Mortierella sp. NVP41]